MSIAGIVTQLQSPEDIVLRGLTAGAVAAPVFSGSIDNISVNENSGTYQYDYSSHFSDATSYSIAPAVEAGWSFNTSTCILEVDSNVVGVFGSYVITGTNVSGSDDSNAFTVTVVETAFSGGFFDYPLDRPRLKPKKKEDEKAAVIIEQIAEKIAKTPIIETNKDIEVALRFKLEIEHVKYKKLYLQWAKQQIKAEEARIKRKKRKQEDELIIMMMLH